MSDAIVQQPQSAKGLEVEFDDDEGGFLQRNDADGDAGNSVAIPRHLIRLISVDKVYLKESVPIAQAAYGNTISGCYEILDGECKLLYRIPRRPGNYCHVFCCCCYKCTCPETRRNLKGIPLTDASGRTVIRFPIYDFMCCANYITLKEEASGKQYGSVFQCCPILSYFDNYDVRRNGKTVLQIRGPNSFDLCFVNTCGKIHYTIQEVNGNLVGEITRKRKGDVSNTDEFTITFPAELDVYTKATIISFVYFVDWMYLESAGMCCTPCVSRSGPYFI